MKLAPSGVGFIYTLEKKCDMILDGITLLLCILAFIRGWKKGMLWAIVSIIAVIVGIVVSLKFSHMLADYLFTNNILTNSYTLLISFVLLFILTIFLFRTLIRFVEKILETVLIGWVNNVLGGLLYGFLLVFLISTFFWLCNKANLLNKSQMSDSKTYTYVEPIAPKTVAWITPFIPYAKTLYKDIEEYFEKLSNKSMS